MTRLEEIRKQVGTAVGRYRDDHDFIVRAPRRHIDLIEKELPWLLERIESLSNALRNTLDCFVLKTRAEAEDALGELEE